MKKLFLLFFLFSPSLAFAVTSQTQYVTFTCANNGDGTAASCSGSPGGVGAFNSWSNWEGQNTDLVSADKDLTVIFSGTMTSGSSLAGWTTDATHKIKLHGLILDSTDYGILLTIDQNYVTLEDSTLSKTGSGYKSMKVLLVTGTAVVFTLQRVTVFHGPSVGNDGGNVAVEIQDTTSGVKTIRNVLVYNSKNAGMSISLGATNTIHAYNITVVGSVNEGLSISCNAGCGTSTVNLKNTVCSGNGIDFDLGLGGETFNHATNVSSDATSPDVGGRSKTITYNNVGADDYSPASGETDLIDAGTDLSGTGFSDDRNGATRSGTWDIGAYEFAGGGGGGTTDLILLDFAEQEDE